MKGTKQRARKPAGYAEDGRHDRIRDWMGPLVTDAAILHSVSARGLQGDESLRPADSPVLWEVGVRIEHHTPVPSVYSVAPGEEFQRGEFAAGTDKATLTITISHPRGVESEPKTYEIDCDLAHLDTLAETLTAALVVGRRDGIIPVATGIKPWTATVGQRVLVKSLTGRKHGSR